ncbi:hypothetical protein GBAR_LOCUS22344 [Geodia barretti]|uniref:Uncharacterized protein n=1 Tax=Geodia barretti TaxID=519541 RepID=A0AA35T254_GEOBA|nr:hypothetical protein GBAR_LOCUS22344 [Geodia barretti]
MRSSVAVFLSNCVLSFHRHGMQGNHATQQVTRSSRWLKVFHLLWALTGRL